MSLHSQVQCLCSLQEEESVEWGHARSYITQRLDARFDDEGERAECLSVNDSVIRRVRGRELREPPGALPIEVTRIDDRPAAGGSMSPFHFSRSMHTDSW